MKGPALLIMVYFYLCLIRHEVRAGFDSLEILLQSSTRNPPLGLPEGDAAALPTDT